LNDYYGELCSQVYETSKSTASDAELEFYLSFIENNDMQVLEPMCGNGRFLLPLFERGIDIEGFDISEEMLSLCRRKGEKLNLKPNIFHCSLEGFKSEKTYDLVIIPFGSFSLMPDELVKDSLSNMRDVLKEGGKLLLTIINKKGEVEEISDWIETTRQDMDGHEIIEYKKMNFDPVKNMLNTKLKYQLLRNGQIEKEEVMDFPVRLYEGDEFERVLKSNGLNDFIHHEVANGYGKGTSFHVYECTK